MEPNSVKNIRNLFKERQIFPSKRLGQNFLINKSVIKQIIAAANLNSKDVVLEIGPGLGALTLELAKKARKVIAVEKDQKMAEMLQNATEGLKNIEIMKEDALKIKINLKSKYKIVANLPYYIASPAIRKFLESQNPPQEMILLIQKEVAQRICAEPPDMNILAVSVQFYSKPKIISFVLENSFWPKPKVDGAILRISDIGQHKSKEFTNTFFKIVKAGFLHPRKQLANNLSEGLNLNKEKVKNWLSKNGILPHKRAENLLIKDWTNLTKAYSGDKYLY